MQHGTDIPSVATLYHLQGNVKKTFNYSIGQQFSWNVSDLPNGYYVLLYKYQGQFISKSIPVFK